VDALGQAIHQEFLNAHYLFFFFTFARGLWLLFFFFFLETRFAWCLAPFDRSIFGI